MRNGPGAAAAIPPMRRAGCRSTPSRTRALWCCPRGCALVGVELIDEAVDLPSFRHPARAAYILGPERDSLSGPVLERCAHVVRIPTSFCVNVAMAGAIVMYDRTVTLGRYAPRPLRSGGPRRAAPAACPRQDETALIGGNHHQPAGLPNRAGGGVAFDQEAHEGAGLG